MATTRLEIELTDAEMAALEALFDANREDMAERWGVADMSGFVALLAMHGADDFNSLK